MLPRSLPRTHRRAFDIKRPIRSGRSCSLRSTRWCWLLLGLFFFTMAAQAFPSVYNYFTIEVFNFTSSQIGRSLGAFGITFAVFQAVGALGRWSSASAIRR